ncbi:MAG TPA: hypothetical protein VG164_05680 [Trebonia sp.]|jgi:hypothetical protein|nr:hypothetical protein [Trebonia sp.]
MTRTAYEAEVETRGPGRQLGGLLATLMGVALVVVGTFLEWAPSRTVGGLSVLVGLVALIALVDRSGWLSRLAGAAALVVFVMYVIEAYREFGHDFNTAVGDLRAGAWLQLAAGVVLLIGGHLGSHVAAVSTAVESGAFDRSNLEGKR